MTSNFTTAQTGEASNLWWRLSRFEDDYLLRDLQVELGNETPDDYLKLLRERVQHFENNAKESSMTHTKTTFHIAGDVEVKAWRNIAGTTLRLMPPGDDHLDGDGLALYVSDDTAQRIAAALTELDRERAATDKA